MNQKKVSICCFRDGSQKFAGSPALVAIDVIRATTTAITAASMRYECHIAPTLQAAFETASHLPDALLAGELGGDMPPGFEMTNSPAELATRSDVQRPMVLLSSTGTRLMDNIRCSGSAYLACFRNYGATVDFLAENHDSVVLIGAGTRGEFREEDQMCCAWIAAGLIERGFVPENPTTRQYVERWKGSPREAFLMSRSVDYLRRTGQLRDLNFILGHFDDLRMPCKLSANGIICQAVTSEV
jgi:2-phosphosulfolactate phosphatase